MSLKIQSSKAWKPVYANDNDAFIPEVWAQESLMILEANMVIANLVHRDFQNEIANFGDIVNTRRPDTFTAARKTDTDDVSTSDASSTNVQVPLNQHLYTSFLIRDGEQSKSFKDLVAEYLYPGVLSIAQSLDEIVSSMTYQFLANNAGLLGTDATKAAVIAAREKLNDNKCPLQGRNLVVTPSTEGALLGITDFVAADRIGDEGTALREGSLGRKFGFDIYMCQNQPSIAAGNTIVTGAVNEGDGYVIGSTAITVDALSAAITNGSWCTIAGDAAPQKITGTTGGETPTALVISPGLYRAVVDDAVVTIYTPGAINLSAGYDSGYVKSLAVDAFAVAPKVGQLVTIGAGASPEAYGLMSTPTTTAILPNLPLAAAATNDDAVGIGPAGDYNFAFHKNAVALVTRPLAQPIADTGVKSFVASYNGLSIRVTIGYNMTKQGHQVTLDLLAGVKELDSDLGCVLFA